MTPVCVGGSGGGLREAPRRFETPAGGQRALPSSLAASLVFQAVPVYPLTAGAAACALKPGPRPVPRAPPVAGSNPPRHPRLP